jgi:hypothetical protein
VKVVLSSSHPYPYRSIFLGMGGGNDERAAVNEKPNQGVRERKKCWEPLV